MTTGLRGQDVAPTGAAPKSESLSPIDPSQKCTHTASSRFWMLLIGSIGVVYGDIGTSPLYAFREAVTAAGGTQQAISVDVIYGILSLIVWALIIIVTLKYVVLLLRADNHGEGGTLSLMALAQDAAGKSTRIIFLLGACGAALFFGDAIITPAISVLSAVEGLKLVEPRLAHVVLPITVVIIFGLFAAQRRGTASVAAWFGPIMLVWMVVMAVGGVMHIASNPTILLALSPLHAVRYLAGNGSTGIVALGAVFLAVTGAEALYADLGHFGRKPIQIAWIVMVFPALLLNYAGQGAMLLSDPKTLENPFFLLYPEWALVPVVILATLATIIASQAVITGAFSLTRQAIQLKLLPRLDIRHTSESEEGQIYMPQVNLLLLIGVLLIVAMFGSSDRLATAYGISVTGTMVVTACLAFIVVWKHWGWSRWSAALLIAPFLTIDLIFFGANSVKIVEGGFVPLLIAAGFMICMWTWTRGTKILFDKTRRSDVPLLDLLRSLEKKPPHQVPGAAVFLTSDPETTPGALLHSLKHYKVLHEKNVMLTIMSENVPRVPLQEQIVMEPINANFSRIILKFGYMDEPNVPKALLMCRKMGWKFDIMSTSFFLSRRAIRIGATSEMPRWQDNLFILLARNASDASAYFHIPTGRVVEIGTQISI
jgi:KUP system potassium uptake protein